jgi:aminopeptidase-like protein
MKKNRFYKLIKKLFPLNRSLAGPENLKTLEELKKINSNLKIYSFNSDTKVYDWVVPKEWIVNEAWVKLNGKKIIDFKKNNLHLLNFSCSFQKKLNYKDLNMHLYSIKKQPDAIPYLTSYYKKNWGFCLKHSQRVKLPKNKIYDVKIDTRHIKGKMHYGEIYFKGQTNKEIFLSTYICHPSMANNELSGPTIQIYLSKFIESIKNRKYSYRLVFLPETIGSISYINKNLKKLKKNVICGFNLNCLGDNRVYSYLPSKFENTFSDHVIINLLNKKNIKYKKYTWLDRGSDERQYCSPGVNLPIASLMRSKFMEFPEYHTSKDILGKVVTNDGLSSSFLIYKDLIKYVENNYFLKSTFKCEAFLSKRSMYPATIEKYKKYNYLEDLLNVLSYCDGATSVYNILNKCNLEKKQFLKIEKVLLKHKLIDKSKIPF